MKNLNPPEMLSKIISHYSLGLLKELCNSTCERWRPLRRYWLILPLMIWRLENGQKLFKCHEKPSSVYKMQENAWRPWLRSEPAGGAYSAPPDS